MASDIQKGCCATRLRKMSLGSSSSQWKENEASTRRKRCRVARMSGIVVTEVLHTEESCATLPHHHHMDSHLPTWGLARIQSELHAHSLFISSLSRMPTHL